MLCGVLQRLSDKYEGVREYRLTAEEAVNEEANKENVDPEAGWCYGGEGLGTGDCVEVFCNTNMQWYAARIAAVDEG